MTPQQSISTVRFSFRGGVITTSVAREILPKSNSKAPSHKNKASINLFAKICGYQKKSKKSKSLEWGTFKEKIARKRYVRENKSHKFSVARVRIIYISNLPIHRN